MANAIEEAGSTRIGLGEKTDEDDGDKAADDAEDTCRCRLHVEPWLHLQAVDAESGDAVKLQTHDVVDGEQDTHHHAGESPGPGRAVPEDA